MSHKYTPLKEITSEVRAELKKKLPEWKFSVQVEDGIAIGLYLMSGPKPVLSDGKGYAQLNLYDFLQSDNRYNNGANLTVVGSRVMKEAIRILMEHHWDESDSMVDYFHCAFYVHVGIGKWGRNYQVK